MIYLETWRCSACPRILGENVRMGDGSAIAAKCWGCGALNLLGSAVTEEPEKEHEPWQLPKRSRVREAG